MTTYARINAAGEFDRLIELTPEEYAALEANGKASWLRLWVVDTKPIPSATQVVTDAGIVIGPVEAHQTWALRDKTAPELNAEQIAADQPSLVQMITALTADIDAYTANPDLSGTAAEWRAKVDTILKDLQRQQRRDNRILRHYLRSLT